MLGCSFAGKTTAVKHEASFAPESAHLPGLRRPAHPKTGDSPERTRLGASLLPYLGASYSSCSPLANS